MPVVVVLVLVAVVVFVVVQRRRWSREKIIDGSQLYALGPMGDDDSDTEGGLRGWHGCGGVLRGRLCVEQGHVSRGLMSCVFVRSVVCFRRAW